VALGVDLNARLALSMRYHRGWHFTGICGSFGAAAAAGRLLGLDEERMRHALGIAYCETAGVSIGSSEGTHQADEPVSRSPYRDYGGLLCDGRGNGSEDDV
jgi:2-methylcitrate dehydratase PrpD